MSFFTSVYTTKRDRSLAIKQGDEKSLDGESSGSASGGESQSMAPIDRENHVKDQAPPAPSTPFEDMDAYLDDFMLEYVQVLEAIANALDCLQVDPADQKAINTLFRNAHNMKGGSYALGLHRLGDFFRRMENSTEPSRKRGKAFSPRLGAAIRMALDELKNASILIRERKSDADIDFGKSCKALEEAAEDSPGGEQ